MRIEMNENTAAAISDAINDMAMRHDVRTDTGRFWDHLNWWFASQLERRGMEDPFTYSSGKLDRIGK